MGNKPAALPGWLCVGLTVGMPGSAPTGSGDVTVTGGSGASCGSCDSGGSGAVVAGVVGAVMVTAADALAALSR